MKKFMAAVIGVFAVLTLCVCLAACAKGEITGTWKLSSQSYTFGGQTQTIKVGDVAPWGDGTEKVTADDAMFIVKEDNTLVSKTRTGASEHTENGTWSEKDGKYEFVVGGVTYVGTLDGNTLTLKADMGDGNSSTVVLKK